VHIAGTPAEKQMDVGPGVPKHPVLRELFVDGRTALPICKIKIF
jgi:hypothetical protein